MSPALSRFKTCSTIWNMTGQVTKQFGVPQVENEHNIIFFFSHPVYVNALALKANQQHWGVIESTESHPGIKILYTCFY